ncbi:MAG: c-type cytochrome [Pyrinomonadaceae bacterium]
MSQRRTIYALKLFILSLTLVLTATHWMQRARAGAQGPPQAGALVEQNHPNIQVLKGLPESQLIPLMNYINASLGVGCDFCHAPTRDPKTGVVHLDFASDAKEEKQTARRMMQMTMSINQTNKLDVGNDPVACYTCHRGSNHPANVPTLPLPPPPVRPGGGGPGGPGPVGPPGPPGQGAPATGAGPQSGPGATAATPRPTPPPRPSAQQVIDKYIAAVGGRDAVAKVQTRSMKGTRASLGREAPYEVTLKGADKLLVVAATQQGGNEMQSYSGTSGWLVNAQDHRALSPEELENLRRTAGIYDLVQLSAATPTMRVTRPERVGEQLANVITNTPAPGVVEKFYFDQETGLLLRRLRLTSTMIAPLPEQWDFSDYRAVEGVQVPFAIAISTPTPRANSTRKFTEIKFNAPVDDAQFQMPAAAPKP